MGSDQGFGFGKERQVCDEDIASFAEEDLCESKGDTRTGPSYDSGCIEEGKRHC